jgi:hypothetical protein
MDKIAALWNLFRAGEAVQNPRGWKVGQLATTGVVAAIWALLRVAKAFGYEIPLDADSVDALAGGVVVVVNLVLTLTTSAHVGILRARPADVPGVDQAAAPAPAAGAAGAPAATDSLPPESTFRPTDPFRDSA